MRPAILVQPVQVQLARLARNRRTPVRLATRATPDTLDLQAALDPQVLGLHFLVLLVQVILAKAQRDIFSLEISL